MKNWNWSWTWKMKTSSIFGMALIAAFLMRDPYFTDSKSLLIPVAVIAAIFLMELFINNVTKPAPDKMVIVEIDERARGVKKILNLLLTIAFFAGILAYPKLFKIQDFNLFMAFWFVVLLCKVFFLSPKTVVVDFGKFIRIPLGWRIEWKSLLGFKLDESNNVIFFQSSAGDKKVKISKTNDLGMLVESLHRMGVKQM